MRRFVVIDGGLSQTSNPPPVAEIRTMKKGSFSSWSESDRDEIVHMIDWGWTDQQILQMLPHIERGSITAFRAHVTRGTYNGQEHSHDRKRTTG